MSAYTKTLPLWQRIALAIGSVLGFFAMLAIVGGVVVYTIATAPTSIGADDLYGCGKRQQMPNGDCK